MSQNVFFQLILNQVSRELFSAETEGDLVAEREQLKVKPPSLYSVIMYNDDYTPMDFVTEVLQRFFEMSLEKATQVMMSVHTKGQAVCGVYSKDVAETKSLEVNRYSRENEHPLLCEIKRAS